MKVLVDTHVFLWMDNDLSRLSPAVQAAINNENNEIFLSVASVWEIVIKQAMGKLSLSSPIADAISAYQVSGGLLILPIALNHVLAVRALPDVHKDPFDRILISQAIIEDAVPATDDKVVSQYPVRILW